MIWNIFSVTFITYYSKKHELFLKFTFHGFDAHLKEYVSARLETMKIRYKIFDFDRSLQFHIIFTSEFTVCMERAKIYQ